VLTRHLAGARVYAATLAPIGLTVIAMPVTRTEAAADPDALVHALDDGEYDAIVVASARAAHELARAASLRITGTGIPERAEVWAVGPATKRALDEAAVPATLPPDVRDAAELAARLLEERELAGKRVLLPRAEDGRTEAAELLRDAGAIVVEVIAYRTRPAHADDPLVQDGANALVDGAADVLCVFAPSQVTALAAVLAERGLTLPEVVQRGVVVCAIGETTAQALREAGIERVAVATAPTPQGMAHAVRSVYPTRT
jgi:uroporphyrinogen-III synthase